MSPFVSLRSQYPALDIFIAYIFIAYKVIAYGSVKAKDKLYTNSIAKGTLESLIKTSLQQLENSVTEVYILGTDIDPVLMHVFQETFQENMLSITSVSQTYRTSHASIFINYSSQFLTRNSREN